MMGLGGVTKSGRPLVVCFDGTADQFDDDNTNVVKFFGLLKKDDFNEQLCYYQPGIGTWYERGVVSPLFQWGAKVLDEAFAWHLDAHVMEGYKFIMRNYRVGDKICIFGFSRGAFIARALAGLLHKAGLLPRDNERQVPFAYKLYKRLDSEGRVRCAKFKEVFCQDVRVEFVGVWDTVSSVGTISGRTLPTTYSNDEVKFFRHALALDERRVKFVPECYRRYDPTATLAHIPECTEVKGSFNKDGRKRKEVWVNKPGFVSWLLKRKKKIQVDIKPDEIPDVLEVWFSGCHGDVGGGATLDEEEHSLSNVSLKWMVREVQKSPCGIIFNDEALERAGIPKTKDTPPASTKSESEATPTAMASSSSESSNSNAAPEDPDVMCPPNDRLNKNWLWWALEVVPFRRLQDKDKQSHLEFRPNLGRGRKIPHDKPKFHKSVQRRMTSMGYEPRAKWVDGSEIYVE